MIPNLSELPPLPEEEHPLKKIVRPLAGVIFLLAVAGGLIWLFTQGIQKAANQEMNVTGGLRSVAGDLWNTGMALEIRAEDPDLTTELARLRKVVGFTPQIVVVAAENRAGQPVASHELIYMQGTRQVLAVRVFLDVTERKLDVLSYRTGPEFMDPLVPGR